MTIIPAIDIKNGACVRLFQGDFTQQTTYDQSPYEAAIAWKKQGASLVHIVDLDGAKDGSPVNFAQIKKIAKDVPIEVGGGIRTLETIKNYISAGVTRVVLGTILLEDTEFAKKVFTAFKGKIVTGLDAKNGELMKRGWLLGSGMNILETAKQLESFGAKRIIYTDIMKDGSLTEPNFAVLGKLIQTVSIPVIASGGISTIPQIKKLKTLGVEGAIVGKAFYEKTMDIKEALNVS